MITIWKHLLRFDDVVTLVLPKGATIIHFAEQRGIPCIWEAHELRAEEHPETRNFRIIGTGFQANLDVERHIGTALFEDGMFVFHLFEVT